VLSIKSSAAGAFKISVYRVLSREKNANHPHKTGTCNLSGVPFKNSGEHPLRETLEIILPAMWSCLVNFTVYKYDKYIYFLKIITKFGRMPKILFKLW